MTSNNSVGDFFLLLATSLTPFSSTCVSMYGFDMTLPFSYQVFFHEQLFSL